MKEELLPESGFHINCGIGICERMTINFKKGCGMMSQKKAFMQFGEYQMNVLAI